MQMAPLVGIMAGPAIPLLKGAGRLLRLVVSAGMLTYSNGSPLNQA